MNRLEIKYNIDRNTYDKAAKSLSKAKDYYKTLTSGKTEYSGWTKLPNEFSDDQLNEIKSIAHKIKTNSTALVVVAIGGSYLGFRAAYDFIDNYDSNRPKIFFAGLNLSTDSYSKLLKEIEDEDVSICVISRSGSTLETKVAFDIMKRFLHEKYGDDISNRVYVISGPSDNPLKREADEKGYTHLHVSNDAGGRYSVLAEYGLLPMAVAGIEIKNVLMGACDAECESSIESALNAACVRTELERSGKEVEVLSYFEPYLYSLIEWMKQLYGESEGKDGRGMMPVNMDFTRELHSMGQYLQEGKQIFSETFLKVKENHSDFSYGSTTVNSLNEAAQEGVLRAHRAIDIPIIELILPDRCDRTFGYFVYYLETVCAVSAGLMGVDPFNQPGIEKYKSEMKKVIYNKVET